MQINILSNRSVSISTAMTKVQPQARRKQGWDDFEIHLPEAQQNESFAPPDFHRNNSTNDAELKLDSKGAILGGDAVSASAERLTKTLADSASLSTGNPGDSDESEFLNDTDQAVSITIRNSDSLVIRYSSPSQNIPLGLAQDTSSKVSITDSAEMSGTSAKGNLATGTLFSTTKQAIEAKTNETGNPTPKKLSEGVRTTNLGESLAGKVIAHSQKSNRLSPKPTNDLAIISGITAPETSHASRIIRLHQTNRVLQKALLNHAAPSTDSFVQKVPDRQATEPDAALFRADVADQSATLGTTDLAGASAVKLNSSGPPGALQDPIRQMGSQSQMSANLDPGEFFSQSEFDSFAPASITGPLGQGVSIHSGDSFLTRPPTTRTIAAQMANALISTKNGNAEIALNPEELGRVRMSLSLTETGISLSISAERQETLDMMRRNIGQLAEEFRSLGFADIDFTFSGGPTDDSPNKNAALSSPHGESELNSDLKYTEPNPNSIARASSSRALDLRL